MKSRYLPLLLPLVAPSVSWATRVEAQASAPGAPTATGAAPGGVSPSAPVPGGGAPGGPGGQALPPGAAVYVPPAPMAPAPAPPFDPNSHLPSSSQPTLDTSRPSDHFDLGRNESGSAVVHGSETAPVVLGSEPEGLALAPQVHTVQRGDTLWGICDRYFHNPWEWPRIWGYNPELQNPHWIYPGDQIRLRGAGEEASRAAAPDKGGKLVSRRPVVPKNTIFLRDQGYIDDDVKDVWGEVGGSPDDQMLLSEGDGAYLDMAPGHDVAAGQELTVFRPLRKISAGDAKGTLVSILGTARVESYDAKTRVARARLTESLNVIERGAKIGPLGRRFDVVPPTRNEVELEAHVAASVYPHALFGENQVVFIDKGQKDGLVPGNRLFVVMRGDAYRQTLQGASEFTTADVRYESDKPDTIEKGAGADRGDESRYPEEVTGEVRVLRTRDHTAACLVVSSTREIEPGQRLIARKGY